MMTFVPLSDRVLVKPDLSDEVSKGGILLPEQAQEKPMMGKVVAVGPGRRDEAGKFVPMELRTGERILFGKWSGTEIQIDGEDLVVMREGDVFGKVSGSDAIRRVA